MTIQAQMPKAKVDWLAIALVTVMLLQVARAPVAQASANVQVDGWGGWMETHTIDSAEPDSSGAHSYEGDIVIYQLKVANSGGEALSNFSVTDDRVNGQGTTWTCSQQTLQPDDAMFCYASGDYQITAADSDVGKVINTIDVRATGVDSGSVNSSQLPQVVNLHESGRSIFPAAAIDAVAERSDNNSNGRVDAGDTIRYRFTVTNVSASTVSNISATNYQNFDGQGTRPEGERLSCPKNSLQPRETMQCAIAETYTVTPDDETSGSVTSVATVAGLSEVAPNNSSGHEDVNTIATRPESKPEGSKRPGPDSASPPEPDSQSSPTDGSNRDPISTAPPVGSGSQPGAASSGDGLIPAAKTFLTSPKTSATAPVILSLALIGLSLARRRASAIARTPGATHRAEPRDRRRTHRMR